MRDDHSLESFWTAVCALRCAKTIVSIYFLKRIGSSYRKEMLYEIQILIMIT